MPHLNETKFEGALDEFIRQDVQAAVPLQLPSLVRQHGGVVQSICQRCSWSGRFLLYLLLRSRAAPASRC